MKINKLKLATFAGNNKFPHTSTFLSCNVFIIVDLMILLFHALDDKQLLF